MNRIRPQSIPAANGRISTISAVIMLMLTTLPAAATLQWDSTEISLEAALGDKDARTAFVYRNTGQDPVTILAARSNCGCTAAIADDPIVLPGESGKIDVHFTFGDRIGPQRITTRVRTDPKTNPDTTLTLRVDIPAAITATPRAVVWQHPNTPPPVILTVHPSITVKSFKTDPPDHLEVTITPITDPERPSTFTLQFKPSSDFQPGRFTVSDSNSTCPSRQGTVKRTDGRSSFLTGMLPVIRVFPMQGLSQRR